MLLGAKSTTFVAWYFSVKKNLRLIHKIPSLMAWSPGFHECALKIKNSLTHSKIDVSFVWLEEEDSSL